MGLLDIFKTNRNKKVFVLGLDGLPYTFLQKLINEDRMPNLSALLETGEVKQMDSVLPPVSSVAWASYMTGKNPAKHNILGFIDRKPDSYETYIPTGQNLFGKTLWEYLSEAGKKVMVMNVPVTYPPRAVNGILISGFLATKLEKATYPKKIAAQLQNIDYQIDVDSWKARESLTEFAKEIYFTLDKRIEALQYFLTEKEWDFSQCHIMCTDRLHHFFWNYMETDHPEYAPLFYKFYQQLDKHIGDILNILSDETDIIVLSDHGFCSIKKEFNLNAWLKNNEWLQFTTDNPKKLNEIHPSSKAFSLIPGRVYINLKDREPNGSVSTAEYDSIREALKKELLSIKEPISGENVIQNVFLKEEIYSVTEGFESNIPDLIALPNNGYDLKAQFNSNQLFKEGILQGMHTYDDAFIFVKEKKLVDERFSIINLMPTIFELMNVDVPEDIDGSSVLKKK